MATAAAISGATLRRLARRTTFGVKAALAAVALAALVAWPWMYWNPRVIEGERYTYSDPFVTREWVVRGWADGRLGTAWGTWAVMTGEPHRGSAAAG